MFENFWECVLTGILLWTMIEEIAGKKPAKAAQQPVTQKAASKNIRPV